MVEVARFVDGMEDSMSAFEIFADKPKGRTL